jgi:hypothetical protein
MGGWIAQKVPVDGYKIIFYSTTAVRVFPSFSPSSKTDAIISFQFSALVQLVGLFYLKETYGPVLLRRRGAFIPSSVLPLLTT